MENVNKPILNFPCDICDKSFKLKIKLKEHIKSLHQDYKHPCDQCEYTTTEKGNLKRHMRTKHEGVRYNCDECSYSGSTNHKVIIFLLKGIVDVTFSVPFFRGLSHLQ